jgi:hypothetical protein
VSTWVRRPLLTAVSRTVRTALRPPIGRSLAGLADALWRLPAVVRRREPLPPWVEEQVRRLDTAGG